MSVQKIPDVFLFLKMHILGQVQLQSMDDTQKEEAFYTPLEFGTAGMRGIVGPGINRMNMSNIVCF